MLNQNGLIHLFCYPIITRQLKKFSLPSFACQSYTNKQSAPLADSCIHHWFELFYKMPRTIYCEYSILPRKYVALASCPYQSLDTKIGFTPCKAENTVTTRYGVTRKRNKNRLKCTGNLFKKTLKVIGVC